MIEGCESYYTQYFKSTFNLGLDAVLMLKVLKPAKIKININWVKLLYRNIACFGKKITRAELNFVDT